MTKQDGLTHLTRPKSDQSKKSHGPQMAHYVQDHVEVETLYSVKSSIDN